MSRDDYEQGGQGLEIEEDTFRKLSVKEQNVVIFRQLRAVVGVRRHITIQYVLISLMGTAIGFIAAKVF